MELIEARVCACPEKCDFEVKNVEHVSCSDDVTIELDYYRLVDHEGEDHVAYVLRPIQGGDSYGILFHSRYARVYVLHAEAPARLTFGKFCFMCGTENGCDPKAIEARRVDASALRYLEDIRREFEIKREENKTLIKATGEYPRCKYAYEELSELFSKPHRIGFSEAIEIYLGELREELDFDFSEVLEEHEVVECDCEKSDIKTSVHYIYDKRNELIEYFAYEFTPESGIAYGVIFDAMHVKAFVYARNIEHYERDIFLEQRIKAYRVSPITLDLFEDCGGNACSKRREILAKVYELAKRIRGVKRPVILDTSILMRVAETGLPLFNELDRLLYSAYEPVVLKKTVRELETLLNVKKKRLKARLALELVKRKAKIIDVDAEGYGDDLIIEAAKRLNAYVATADSNLMKRLLREGIPVIYPRDYKTLELAGEDVR